METRNYTNEQLAMAYEIYSEVRHLNEQETLSTSTMLDGGSLFYQIWERGNYHADIIRGTSIPFSELDTEKKRSILIGIRESVEEFNKTKKREMITELEERLAKLKGEE